MVTGIIQRYSQQDRRYCPDPVSIFRESWEAAGTYDPEGQQQGGEAATLKQLKLTLEVSIYASGACKQ